MIREEIAAPWPAPLRELIDTHPPLPHAEQVALCHCWQQQGDEAARNRLATSSLRFILRIALAYRGRGMDLVDLVQEGTLGCMEAIDRYDSTRGFKFITYAVWWIRQAMQTALATQVAPIRHPVSWPQAPAPELRSRLEQPPERTSAVYYSLDAPVAAGDGHGLRAEYSAELASAEDSSLAVEARELREIVNALLLPGFSARERYILERYYGLADAPPMTLEKLGHELGITRERVRQLKAVALKKMQKQVNGHREEYREMMAD